MTLVTEGLISQMYYNNVEQMQRYHGQVNPQELISIFLKRIVIMSFTVIFALDFISVSTLWLLFKVLVVRDLPIFTSVTVHSVVRVKGQAHSRASQTKNFVIVC
jgi:hypothetical protein